MNSIDINKLVNVLKKYDYPIEVNSDSQLLDYFENTLSEYCTEIYKCNISQDSFNYLKEIEETLIKSIKQYQKGLITNSTRFILEMLINNSKDFLFTHIYEQPLIIPKSYNNLYRGRCGDLNSTFKREDLLHIPFNKREYISTQRFSIPGLPCLYLGNSIYIIWNELNRPSFENFYVSRFKANSNLIVLDLAIFSKDVEKYTSEFEYDENYIKKIIFTKLLSISCSFKIKVSNRHFKSEYIIPQLLMLALIYTSDTYGIRYFSMYSNTLKNSPNPLAVNYVFPTIQTKDNEKHSSKLLQHFTMSSPCNIEIIEKNLNENRLKKSSKPIFSSSSIYINEEHGLPYKDSIFFKLEQELSFHECKTICNK